MPKPLADEYARISTCGRERKPNWVFMLNFCMQTSADLFAQGGSSGHEVLDVTCDVPQPVLYFSQNPNWRGCVYAAKKDGDTMQFLSQFY
jgi:hypothetical protein